jgi:large subunit ribosomal protein L3
MGARNRTQQNLEIVRTDLERGLLFVKGSVPGHKGSWCLVKDAVKVPAHADIPYPAGLKVDGKESTHEEAPAGMVEAAAVHEIPALPSDAEVAAIAAEQEAGAAASEAAADAAQAAADESKEG